MIILQGNLEKNVLDVETFKYDNVALNNETLFVP